MAHLIRNERAKLLATFLNNIAVALIAGAALVPVFGLLADSDLKLQIAGSAATMGVMLHLSRPTGGRLRCVGGGYRSS